MTVRTELETRVNTWVTTRSPVLQVAYENVAFTKPTSGQYLEVDFLTGVTTNPTVDVSSEREYGIMQILVCTKAGTGNSIVAGIIEEIKLLFPVVPKTGTVSIERPVNVSAGVNRDDGWYVVPVRISYRQER